MAIETLTDADTVQSLTFPKLPPFPSDIPIAPLHRLVLSRLRSDPAESERLFSSSKDLGFFYLDLRQDEDGEVLLDEAERLFGLAPTLYELGREELQKYDYKAQGSYMGYKGLGASVADENGNLDRTEYYNVRLASPKVRVLTARLDTERWLPGCIQNSIGAPTVAVRQ